MSDDRAALMALAKARAVVRQKMPYLSSAVLTMTPVASDIVPTMGVTDGLTLFYNRAWVIAQKTDELAGVHVHEVMHVVHKHYDRRGEGRDQRRWNIAGDIAINPTILKEELKLPEGHLLPGRYGLQEGLTIEQYYDLLENKLSIELGGSDGEGDVCQGNCGSVACGSGGGAGKPAHSEDRPKSEVAQIVKEVRRAIKEHVRSHPGHHWGLSIDELDADDSKVPWQQVLRHVLRRNASRICSGATDYSMTKLSRRSFQVEYPLPGLIDRKLEPAIAIDTSGSMSESRLRAALGEAVGIFRASGAHDVWLIECDCRIAAKPRRVAMRSLLHAKLHGGGGTSFDPVLHEVEKLRPRPRLLVYLTDGEGSASYRPKGVEVVWGVVGGFTEWLRNAGWENVVAIE